MALGKRRRRLATVGMGVSLALAATGCLQDPNASSGGVGGVGGNVDNSQSDGDGVVTVLGAFGGAEQEAFEASIKAFEDESGIDLQYTADTDFTTTIKTRVAAGDAPDIAFFPQPGGLLEQAEAGAVQPIDTYLDFDELERTLVPGLLETGRLNGRVYGAPVKLANKSIVWYPKKAWEQGSYQAPKSLDDLYRLTDQINADGITPWCMAWNADQATGWVGTDWVEQFMLTLYGVDAYNDWVDHRIPFNDPNVVKALDEFAKIAKDDSEVYGGVRTVVNTPANESMYPAFRNPPECMLERQGDFASAFLPADIQENLDEEVGVFAFPSQDPSVQNPPILGGADLAALFNGNDDEAIEAMRFLTSDQFGAESAPAGGWLSPHTTFDASNYPNQTIKDIAQQVADASGFVFDASDVMPKEVGSGTFWTEMVKWIQGESSESTADAIEGSWPE